MDPLSIETLVLCGPLETSDYLRRALPPLSGDSPNSATQPCAQLGSIRAEGALWRVYDLKEFEHPYIYEFVLKLAIPAIQSGNATASTSYDAEQASAAILNDCLLLSGPLRPLQGTVIPEAYGIYVGKYNGLDAWSMVVEDGGRPISVTNLEYRHK